MTDSLDTRAVDALLGSVGGDAEFLGELVGTFLEEAPVQLAELQTAAAAGDADTLRRGAHTLKSNAATFGIVDLETHSRELERRAHDGNLAGADALVSAIGEALAEARPALQELMASDAR